MSLNSVCFSFNSIDFVIFISPFHGMYFRTVPSVLMSSPERAGNELSNENQTSAIWFAKTWDTEFSETD